MPPYRLFCALLLLLAAPPAGTFAQVVAVPVPRPVSSEVLTRSDGPLHSALRSAPPDTVRTGIRPTYWKEGAFVGGVAGGVTLGLLGTLVCGLSEQRGRDCASTTLLAGLLGAGLGAIPGALIGGAFPKAPRKARE